MASKKKKTKKSRGPRRSYAERLEAAAKREEQRMAQKLLRAGDWLIRFCLINNNWVEENLASIVLVRERPDGALAGAFFLIDLGCFGIKEVGVQPHMTWAEANHMRRAAEGPDGDLSEAIEPHDALKIIQAGRDWAQPLGFEPTGGTDLALMMFKGIDASQSTLEVTCGVDGKPMYIEGPRDNPAAIIAHLTERLGPDGFNFMSGAP